MTMAQPVTTTLLDRNHLRECLCDAVDNYDLYFNLQSLVYNFHYHTKIIQI